MKTNSESRRRSVEETYQAFMLDHAAGNLPAGLTAAAQLHQTLSQQGQETAALWDTVKRVLDSGQPIRCGQQTPRQDGLIADELLNSDLESLKWRRGISGVRYSGCGVRGGKLMRLEPAQSVPTHGHSALEATVVLQGELSDGHDTYGIGEIMIASPGDKHKPAASGNAACICYVAKGSTAFWRFT